jgi:branched-chain amino acid transport system permease protein
VLVGAGLLIGLVGLPIERLLLRTVYRRDESYQLLLTFGLLLMFQDVFRFVWGATPRTLDNAYLVYGTAQVLGVRVPTYNLLVIAASLAIALGLGAFLQRTRTGRIIRATAENRDMAEGMGVDASRIFALVFTVGCMLGTVGGALVVPAAASSLDMAVELVVEAFAVVVIGGLGSMRGALVGALVVGLMRAAAISVLPEVEMLSVYLVVVAVLILRPAGLFGRAAA